MYAQHNKRLKLKFITFRTTLVLQKYMNAFEQPPEDEERKHHHVMIRVAMSNRIYLFHHRIVCNIAAAFLILVLGIFRIGLQVIVDKK